MRTIRRLLEHLTWANKELLAGLREQPNASGEIGRLFRHILIAERVWVTRLEGGSSAHLTLWEESDIAPLEELARDNERRYKRYIAGLSESDLDRMLDYANQSGVRFRTSIRDILIHVALHGQYHRGQINNALRRQAGSPVALDYILLTQVPYRPNCRKGIFIMQAQIEFVCVTVCEIAREGHVSERASRIFITNYV